MCTEVNSTMGLQATAATKRKHEITFDSKDTTTYTNCPPPIKASKWSMNNNNYIEAIEEQSLANGEKSLLNGHGKPTKLSTIDVDEATKLTTANNNNNNNNNENKNCTISCNGSNNSTNATPATATTNDNMNNDKSKEYKAASMTSTTTMSSLTTSSVNSLVTTIIPAAAEVLATTPLPPTSTTPVPEDSIAKLEVVAAAPCEPWTTPEPVDCISKLQAVAVPCDPWGSISTRSTLATTLLSADELDDDDDDFEDDYEEEESIIPTYCPVRYPPFQPASPSSQTHQSQRLASFSPPHGYGSRPNYYSEPFPQQNCSRTGNQQHLRLSSNGFQQWQSLNGSGSPSQFYMQPESAYPPPQQQQTIRCAENGKSYMELGCSSPPPSPPPPIVTHNGLSGIPPPPFSSIHTMAGANLDARHPFKRCCDGRGTWCNTNKNCYKDIRLKIRNLSMFKLSRFRQVSEQSLYRSVLICNTLKRIDREIEAEAKELHQAAAAAHHHQQTQYHLHNPPHHLQHHPAHLSHQQHSHQAVTMQQQASHLHHQQQQQQQPHTEFSPVMNCARVASMDYQSQHLHQHPQQQQQASFPQSQMQHQYHSQAERSDMPPNSNSSAYLNAPAQAQKTVSATASSSTTTTTGSNGFMLNGISNCDSTLSSSTTPLHPYDHYPFRESQSGRATPFPCQPVITSPPQTPASTTQTTQTATAHTVPSNNNTSTCANTAVTVTTPTTSVASSNIVEETDYADDDSTRPINWSSVLSLSSQSALDPLNNNDLFAILPPVSSLTNPATATPVSLPTSATATSSSTSLAETQSTVAISGTFTTMQPSCSSSTASSSSSTTAAISSPLTSPTFSTTATFTTLSTISSATHSLTSSYVSSISSSAAVSASSASTWEYGFLEMDFGLGTEFTELMPSCKLSSDELFKNSLTPVGASTRYDNELEQPAHIMVS